MSTMANPMHAGNKTIEMLTKKGVKEEDIPKEGILKETVSKSVLKKVDAPKEVVLKGNMDEISKDSLIEETSMNECLTKAFNLLDEDNVGTISKDIFTTFLNHG